MAVLVTAHQGIIKALLVTAINLDRRRRSRAALLYTAATLADTRFTSRAHAA
jgi:hypothetical protein